MKQMFENLKIERPFFNEEENRKVKVIADSILSQISGMLDSIGFKKATEKATDSFPLNDKPIMMMCAILEVERVMAREKVNFKCWIDDSTEIPTLNYIANRN